MADEKQSKASEMMKKVLTIGVGTLFLTEESLRSLVSEFKLPKDILAGVLDSAAKSRKEFMDRLAHDVIGKLKERVDLKDLISDYLDQHEVQITVQFSPKGSSKKKSKEQ